MLIHGCATCRLLLLFIFIFFEIHYLQVNILYTTETIAQNFVEYLNLYYYTDDGESQTKCSTLAMINLLIVKCKLILDDIYDQIDSLSFMIWIYITSLIKYRFQNDRIKNCFHIREHSKCELEQRATH